MSDLDVSGRISALRSTFSTIEAVVNPENLRAEIAALSEQASAPGLWEDTDNAQKVTSALSHRQSELARVTEVSTRLNDLDVLVEMAKEAGDQASVDEVHRELDDLERILGEMEIATLLDGEYDSLPALITIRAGAGGVDAADFAEM
jgi:peptide chain release factor 2